VQKNSRENLLKQYESTAKVLKDFLKKPSDTFGLLEYLQNNKSSIYQVLDIMLIGFRDLCVKKYNVKTILLNNEKDYMINNIPDDMYRILLSVEETKKNLLRNANFDLCINKLALEIQEVFNG
jgi:hypothetical protein